MQAPRCSVVEVAVTGWLAAFNATVTTASKVGKVLSYGLNDPNDVAITRNIEYAWRDGAALHLDIYRPRQPRGPLPVVFYAHGGAFCTLSKDTHWMAALEFARAGCVVVSINHRMAPQHTFPAALEDAVEALLWTQAHIGAYEGDVHHLALAGDSSGGNIVTSLAIATSFRLDEPYAATLFASNVKPRVVLPVSATLDMTWIDGHVASGIEAVACGMYAAYLGAPSERPASLRLADPLPFLESAGAPDRPLPAFFVAAGTRDPLQKDSQRLAAALQRLDVPHHHNEYKGFHAPNLLWWTSEAKRYWGDAASCLKRWQVLVNDESDG